VILRFQWPVIGKGAALRLGSLAVAGRADHEGSQASPLKAGNQANGIAKFCVGLVSLGLPARPAAQAPGGTIIDKNRTLRSLIAAVGLGAHGHVVVAITVHVARPGNGLAEPGCRLAGPPHPARRVAGHRLIPVEEKGCP